MDNEQLTDLVLKSVQVAKDMVEGKFDSHIPKINVMGAQGYLNELKNFYGRAQDDEKLQKMLLCDFKKYLVDRSMFSKEFFRDYGPALEKLGQIKNAGKVTCLLTGLCAMGTYFVHPAFPILSDVFAICRSESFGH